MLLLSLFYANCIPPSQQSQTVKQSSYPQSSFSKKVASLFFRRLYQKYFQIDYKCKTITIQKIVKKIEYIFFICSNVTSEIFWPKCVVRMKRRRAYTITQQPCPTHALYSILQLLKQTKKRISSFKRASATCSVNLTQSRPATRIPLFERTYTK